MIRLFPLDLNHHFIAPDNKDRDIISQEHMPMKMRDLNHLREENDKLIEIGGTKNTKRDRKKEVFINEAKIKGRG